MAFVLAIWVTFAVGGLFGYWLAGGFHRGPVPQVPTIADTRPPTNAEIDARSVFRSPGFRCPGCSECQPPKVAKG